MVYQRGSRVVSVGLHLFAGGVCLGMVSVLVPKWPQFGSRITLVFTNLVQGHQLSQAVLVWSKGSTSSTGLSLNKGGL